MSIWIISAREEPGEASCSLFGVNDEKIARDLAAAQQAYVRSVKDLSGEMEITSDNIDEYHAAHQKWWRDSPLGLYVPEVVMSYYNRYYAWELPVYSERPVLDVFSVDPGEFHKHIKRFHENRRESRYKFGFPNLVTLHTEHINEAMASLQELFTNIFKDRSKKFK